MFQNRAGKIVRDHRSYDSRAHAPNSAPSSCRLTFTAARSASWSERATILGGGARKCPARSLQRGHRAASLQRLDLIRDHCLAQLGERSPFELSDPLLAYAQIGADFLQRLPFEGTVQTIPLGNDLALPVAQAAEDFPHLFLALGLQPFLLKTVAPPVGSPAQRLLVTAAEVIRIAGLRFIGPEVILLQGPRRVGAELEAAGIVELLDC